MNKIKKEGVNKFKYLKGENGITLIALVITIIVLLILAGVSIATLTGDNGILTRANDAKEKTEEAEDIEKIRLAISEAQIGEDGYQELNSNNLQEAIDGQFEGRNVVVSDNGDGTFTISCLDTLKDYTISGNNVEEGIDWNEAMANAVAPESQDEERNEGVIGIGTNGQPVDMDLWLYSFDTVTNGYGLNSDEVFQNTEYNPDGTNTETIRTAGYQGTETNGKDIIIPQYISKDGGKTYNPVTSLYRTFNSNTNIITMPIVPTTVINMQSGFEGCTNLKECIMPNSVENINWCWSGTKIEEIKEIPSSVINMIGSFAVCNSLEYANFEVPNKVENLHQAFSNCQNLKEANLSLGDNVKIMDMTFYNCANLEKGPDIIPVNIENLTQTFQGCTKLHGEMTILANPTSYGNCFMLVGEADENYRLIIKDGENNRETLEKLIINSDWQKKHVIGVWDL